MTPTSSRRAAPRRRQARRGQGALLRTEILAATDRLLVATGSEDAVRIRAVADAIGVSPPAIYRHFPDKATLLFEVCAAAFERMDRFIVEAAEGVDDPLDVLLTRARAYVRFGIDNPEHYRIMFMGRSERTPEQYADELLVGTSAFAHLVECVQHCIDGGALRPDLTEAYDLSLALWATIHGVTSLCVAKPCMPGPPPDERLALLLDLALHGLLPKASTSASGGR